MAIIIFLCEIQVKFFAHVLRIGLFYTLLSICGSSLHILDMVTFSDGFIANVFSQSVA